MKPGDLILTGSPPGVGYYRTPPELLKVCLNRFAILTVLKKNHKF
jgi:2-keto-4-pentenoate hydratase/2-oxohepta-3-ene-1,7-dioic acid hydratase in catechol pathway